MEAAITEFINSDTGYITAIVFIVLGLSDLGSSYYITRYKPEFLPIPAEKLQIIMTAIYFAASLLVLIGLYMLYIRA